ncbi:aminoglycoside phosphotransferase family protein [Candidatus Chloroploca asiatica]|uniref:Aminoglycoside phosphotransferase domain-containing protein n=1 Tax=Candidatus Chloroploca asiatica TaxID=1506545 RepID=A0A2H3KHQ2_9CHLR|nr:aminoglycoside phosphotransferase family protein [Candidatus Chloroploca asiatica]PDV97324.1 hypothetical protein A9Q02_18860 [Candidatus Chloroploca asiatica]
MLSSVDAALARRDPALPGLVHLLDPEAFGALLRGALPTLAIGAIEPRYIRYKPGTNCLVGYRIGLREGPTMVYACTYAPSGRAKLARASQLAAQAGALGVGGLVFDEEQIALYSWPHDQALPFLAHLTNPSNRASLLKQFCPAREDLHQAALVHLRYRPERRYVGRLVGAAGGDALLKLYAANDYHLAHMAAEAFQSEGPLALVPPCGASAHVRGLIFPWRPDEPLDTLVRDERDDLRAVRLAGAALATLHRQPAPRLPQTVLATPFVALDANARTLIALCPELQPQIGRLCQVFAAQLPQSLRHPQPLHGDFYADQVLIDPERRTATLLDLDNAHWGDPAADLGNFAAHLQRQVALGRMPATRAATLTEALGAGYAEVAPPPSRQRISLYTALGLLRLAPEPFRYREPDWPVRIHAIVATAEAILTRAFVAQTTPCQIKEDAYVG